MELAKTRNMNIDFISRHLLSAAHQALVKTKQTVIAKILGVADSTVLRRAEKYPEMMEQLAASGVEDFVMKGEKKLPLDQYRWLLTVAMEYSKIQLEMTGNENAPSAGTLEA